MHGHASLRVGSTADDDNDNKTPAPGALRPDGSSIRGRAQPALILLFAFSRPHRLPLILFLDLDEAHAPALDKRERRAVLSKAYNNSL
jgi:hypothetical protein